MGVEARCRPCHSAAHCRHMKRQPCLCHHHPCHGRCHCNCHCHLCRTDSITIAVAVDRCRCCQPLPLRSPSTIATTISVALLSAITVAVAIALAIGNCCPHHRWPSQLPSPLAITVTIAVGHFQELLLGAARIVFDQLKQRMLTLFYFVWTVGGALIKAG
jgi:hypothetical protein